MMGGSLFQHQRQKEVGTDGDDANVEAAGGDGERNDGRIIPITPGGNRGQQ
jgi:hypothetical protein